MNKSNFSSSQDVFKWISGFINLERGQKPKSFRLDRMEFLTELAGNPHKCAPSIHIAGSKGKGSVTSMLASILTAAGYNTARYMSPHVVDIRERLCLNGSYFSEEIYCSAGDELRHTIEVFLPASGNPLFDTTNPDLQDKWQGSEPTFWELLTLLFFLCARKSNCDVMVVETGMGGRLDSTNVLDPLVSIITLIELEHTSILGDTITAIAGEKAGIIKPGKPFILAKQNEEALEVFKKTAHEKNSPLIYFPEIGQISEINISQLGTEFNFSLSSLCDLRVSAPLRESYHIPIPGKVQAENAALAITAIKTAFPQIGDEVIRKGLANLSIPGRFEKIKDAALSAQTLPAQTLPAQQGPFIIDGAHTPESLTLCIETFCSLYGEGGVLLFGCAADKDEEAMARIAAPHFSRIIITTPGTFKISNPQKVYEAFVKIAGREKTELVVDTREAVRRAMELAKISRRDAETRSTQREEGELPILGTGSFYLVAEIRKGMALKNSI